jgi:ribonucleoside-diphosphate reductase alpha chain
VTEAARARAAVVRAFAAAPGETSLEEVAARVAGAVAEAEPASARRRWSERFAVQLRTARFLPSLPALANAGRGGQLAACFVLKSDDSLTSIYETLGRAARVQQGSGGTGIDLSDLRPCGSPIARSGGTTPGPVGFLELFASSARINRSAGRRPGAHLAIVRQDHPDVREFVRAKRGTRAALEGVGLALAVRDSLFELAASDGALVLRDRRGSTCGRLEAAHLLREIAAAIHETGEPSLLFLDAIERGNPLPGLGPITATNPCGEQPLLPDESCVLGSLNLPALAGAGAVLDREALAEATTDAVRFLDDLIDVNRYPDDAIAAATRRTRKIGVGIMGLADLLLLRGIPYGSAASRDLAGEIMRVVRESALAASEALARERGGFPGDGGRGAGRRNATLLAVAPTGTLRLIAGTSGGIEPFIQPVLEIRSPDGDLRWVDRWLEAWSERGSEDPAALLAALEAGEPAERLPGLDGPARALLRRAWEIDATEQIALQAAVQAHVDGAVSKTVHLPTETAPDEIARLIETAARLGCKGASFFRRGCAADPASLEGERPGVSLEARC